MSNFYPGYLNGTHHLLSRQNYRGCREWRFRQTFRQTKSPDFPLFWEASPAKPRNFRSAWWPSRSRFAGCPFGSNDCVMAEAQRIRSKYQLRGANGRFTITGITRDAYGVPLANCTVRLFRNGTDEMVAKVTSDANGLYFATSPYNDGHFIVIHNPTGDRAGATANTLAPA